MNNLAKTNNNVPNNLISVVIPTYNRAHYLPDAINSVLAQTYKNYEIIIIDDGSTDNTSEIIKVYNSKIRYYKQDNNGVSSARNLGIEQSTGEYIAFLDSDDIWLPRKLELQVNLIKKFPETGMVGGGCDYVNSKLVQINKETIPNHIITNEELEIYTAIPGSASNCMIKKSVLNDVGGFDTNLVLGEDRELWMRISRKYDVYAVTEPTVSIRSHDEVRPKRNLIDDLKARKKINKTINNLTLKLKADAWMYFYFFTFWYKINRLLSLYYLSLSFIHYPFGILPNLRRAQPLAEIILPKSIYTTIRNFIK